jgi:hypothetical protein
MAPTVTKTKKRPAGAQGGPKVKKIILEKSDRPQPAVKSQDKNKRRSRPVTAPAADEDEDADEEAWEDEEDAAGAEEDVIEDVAADGEDEAPARPAKDPNGALLAALYRDLSMLKPLQHLQPTGTRTKRRRSF